MTNRPALTLVEPALLPATNGGTNVIDKFIQAMRRRKLSENTIKLRMFYLRKLDAELVGGLPCASLSDLELFVDRWEHRSDATRQTVVAALRAFYSWAFRFGHIADNPATNLEGVRVRRKPARMASEEAIQRGLENGTLQEQAMVLLGAECGLRLEEIASLNTRDRDGEWLTIMGKGDYVREVPMSPELEAILDELELRAVAGYYFAGQKWGTHLHVTTVWRHIRNVTGTNPHSLRHRAGTTVYRKGGRDIRMTQTFLGHASLNTTAIYVHVERDDLMKAAAATRLAA